MFYRLQFGNVNGRTEKREAFSINPTEHPLKKGDASYIIHRYQKERSSAKQIVHEGEGLRHDRLCLQSMCKQDGDPRNGEGQPFSGSCKSTGKPGVFVRFDLLRKLSDYADICRNNRKWHTQIPAHDLLRAYPLPY